LRNEKVFGDHFSVLTTLLVYDKQNDCWLSTDRMVALTQPHNIQCVPILSSTWSGSVAELAALVKQSAFSTKETAEGVYVRFEGAGVVQSRLKYRRANFVAGREDFGKTLLLNGLKE
jgi:hypothetical protein